MKRLKEIINYFLKSSFQYLFYFLMAIHTVFILLLPDIRSILIVLGGVNLLGSMGLFLYLERKLIFRKISNSHLLSNMLARTNKDIEKPRQGLDEETALQLAEIIKKISGVDAVAITDKEKTLTFIGAGCEAHPVGKPIVTKATYEAIHTGQMKIVNSKNEFNCQMKDCICPLQSAIIVPLLNKGSVVGTLKLYYTRTEKISNNTIDLSIGLAQILNLQIELSELDRQIQLATKAQLEALQAQINPHFLFNALNTINMYILKDPKFARRLLVRLSTLLRYLLGNYGPFITLEEELNYIQDYVLIEQARFGNKLKIIKDIEENTKQCLIPVLAVQPLVHNAIQHGILPKEGSSEIRISSHVNLEETIIVVEDDGVGIPAETLPKVLEPGFGTGCGVGLYNVNERLKILYGEAYGLNIESIYGKGTKVWFSVPHKNTKNK
ncbi:two-component system, LytT family, sensor kinase [Natronincola peptidivorans]|uniref:histidine kinase n=1 Tax=Natronincola peptidivorans TaxID=426128 RepID=A0A1I0H003_9FIRM|nr:histidine kinase [Natronincola peptidivorans]SET77029.1 two-component system, LytT family, sensor kinase [Natronincola peptidivorans]